MQSSWEKTRLKSEKSPIKSEITVVDVSYSGSQKQHVYAVCISKASQAPSSESEWICFEQKSLFIQELTSTVTWVIPPFLQHWNSVWNSVRAVFMVKVLGRPFGTVVGILVKLQALWHLSVSLTTLKELAPRRNYRLYNLYTHTNKFLLLHVAYFVHKGLCWRISRHPSVISPSRQRINVGIGFY